MKKIKYLIIGIIVVIIIIAIVILAINLHNRNVDPEAYHQYNDESANTDEINQRIDYKQNLNKVNNPDEFFTIVSCVNQYLGAVNKTNITNIETEGNEELINSLKSSIYNILSQDYISSNNITQDNVYDHVDDISDTIFFIPLKMNGISTKDTDKTENFSTTDEGSTTRYVVYGIEEDINNNYLKDLYIIVNRDNINDTFSIEPVLNAQYTDINDITLNAEPMEIAQNDNNQITSVVANDEYVSKQYLDYYKKLALGRPDIAYNLLDEEYRNKRFGNLEAYEQYIEENRDDIKVIRLSQYMLNRDNNIKQYVCKDAYGKIYMFEEENPMEVSIQLDTYTIETDAFKEQYENGNEQTKAQMNIYKFMLMINNQDFQKAYELLDENFRNNYFRTVDDFIRYVRAECYKYNNMKITNFDITGNIYSCGVEITDATGGLFEDPTKGDGGSGYVYNWTFYVQLGEDRDFTISFDVDTSMLQ